jgi:chemotaxis protein methyltransferase CheR
MTTSIANSNRTDGAAGAVLSESGFAQFARMIREHCGIHLPPVKRFLVETRLRKRLKACGLASFEEYWRHVSRGGPGGGEWIHMIDVITTNKTDFYREPAHFQQLTEIVLPALGIPGTGRGLRVWSAGCSSGEEPYTIAMTLQDYSERVGRVEFSILATDLSTRVLEKARLAVYPLETFDPLPAAWQRKYVMHSKDPSRLEGRIVPELRAAVEFRHLNLLDQNAAIAEKMDVVFCRNVIIYFDRATQDKVVRRLVAQLRPGGYLFMGHAETLNAMDVPLTVVGPTMYRRSA